MPPDTPESAPIKNLIAFGVEAKLWRDLCDCAQKIGIKPDKLGRNARGEGGELIEEARGKLMKTLGDANVDFTTPENAKPIPGSNAQPSVRSPIGSDVITLPLSESKTTIILLPQTENRQ